MDSPFRAVLFHYTTFTALESILRESRILPSLRSRRPRDVRYGEGQYLTDVPPGQLTGAQLSRLLLGHPFEGHRFTHFLALDVTNLEVIQGRKSIFVVLGRYPLNIEGKIVRTGTNANDLYQGSLDPQLRN
jgi:hypothetical protein